MTEEPVKELNNIDDLILDPKNPNRGTARGAYTIQQSLINLGAGRSIVSDKDGFVVAGNQTLKVAKELDIPIEVVQSTGDELVVIQRTDLFLSSETDNRARLLSYADNRASELSLNWDISTIVLDVDAGLELSPLFSQIELDELNKLAAYEQILNGDSYDPVIGKKTVTEHDITSKENELDHRYERAKNYVTISCPKCKRQFYLAKAGIK